MDCFDGSNRVVRIAGGRIALVWIQERDEVMGYGTKLLVVWCSGSDRHVAVDLSRISADDLGIEPLRKLDRETRLSRRGCSREHEDAALAHQIRLNILAISPGAKRTIVGRPCGQCIGFAHTASRSPKLVISSNSKRSPATVTE